MNPLELLASLVALPGPPGQEDEVRDDLAARLDQWGLPWTVDAKGNLLTAPGESIPERPEVVVTAHLDEIALMLTGFDGPAVGRVTPLGGVAPYKWGEGPVEILGSGGERKPAILSFGSVHTTHPATAAQKNREGRAVTWEDARLLLGEPADDLAQNYGIGPGARVVLAPDRRRLFSLNENQVAGPFFDDRADLVAWLLALDSLRGTHADVVFAATVSEETGGEGALWLLGNCRPEICIALEIGPIAPDNGLDLSPHPVVWVKDSYASLGSRDLALVRDAARETHLPLGEAVFTRGGSDASIGQAKGLCARGMTLAFAAENSHGFEVMHVGAMANLAKLTVAILERL